jgi:hypothetical protein
MTLQRISQKSRFRSLLISTIIALTLIVATVYGKYNPISQKLKEANEQILKERKPDFFEININLNDYNLNKLDQIQIENLYGLQPCFFNKYFSLEEVANNPDVEGDKDFDKDGLTNSQEMVLNSNPKEKQTQPGFDDIVLYQDSKSPYNSKIIVKDKTYYINKSYIADEGENLASILNKNCEEGYSFFELSNSERIPALTLITNNPEANNKGFNLFFKKNIELIRHRELDIFLNTFSDDQNLANLELENIRQKQQELQSFLIEKEESKNYLLINDIYTKLIQIYLNTNKAEKANFYKEIIYMLKNQLTV